MVHRIRGILFFGFAVISIAVLTIHLFSPHDRSTPLIQTFQKLGNGGTATSCDCPSTTTAGLQNTNGRNSLTEVLQELQWNELYNSFIHKDSTTLDTLLEIIIDRLLPFIVMEPKIPINETCRPQPLHGPGNWRDCRKRLNQRRVAVLVQLGFDVDSLEIHINELYDIVDQFFIMESTRTHFRAVRKPLIWDSVKRQPRFHKFLHKITHLILDDIDTGEIKQRISQSKALDIDWGIERLQERVRWEKFLHWNNITQTFKDDDLIGFGDTDEIPGRNTILHLKQCEITTDPVDIGIWFPFGNIKNAWRPNSAPGNPYALGDPTYWLFKTAKKYTNSTHYPSRLRGAAKAIRLGGMHMTHYGYLPLQIIKRLTLTESDELFYRETVQFVKSLVDGNKSMREVELKFSEVYERFKGGLTTLETLRRKKEPTIDELVVFPWFYSCNPNRYPTWEGKHDSRLD